MLKLNDLRIYQNANLISDEIWKIASQWNYFEKETIGKQIMRSADSISANIAERYGRYHFKSNKLFCYYSRGSLLETINWLEKCKRRKIIEEKKATFLISELNDLHQKLNAYIKYIGKNENKI